MSLEALNSCSLSSVSHWGEKQRQANEYLKKLVVERIFKLHKFHRHWLLCFQQLPRYSSRCSVRTAHNGARQVAVCFTYSILGISPLHPSAFYGHSLSYRKLVGFYIVSCTNYINLPSCAWIFSLTMTFHQNTVKPFPKLRNIFLKVLWFNNPCVLTLCGFFFP